MAQARQYPALIVAVIGLAMALCVSQPVWAQKGKPAPLRSTECVAAHAAAVQAGDAPNGPEAAASAASSAASEGELGWADSRVQQYAREAFMRCAIRNYGAAAEARAEACAADLYALPVILLFRVDGQSRVAALADLQREGALNDGSDYARRAPVMLNFAYQGAGPAKGQGPAWIDGRVTAWIDQCLSGRLPLPQ
ncbi:hypothetical protein WG899_02465 [Paucibacter sp. AS339]|uniref:hypothetical protein n=1 Tax=Paucibacter hankyongi TaxID=3133434 RepID=UPI0030A8862E